jgi:hypothetical protein
MKTFKHIALDDRCMTDLIFSIEEIGNGARTYSIRVINLPTERVVGEVHLTVREMRDLALILTEAAEAAS